MPGGISGERKLQYLKDEINVLAKYSMNNNIRYLCRRISGEIKR
jgi:hypothetical protein